MRQKRYDMRNGQIPLLPLFVAGGVAGIVIMNLGKSILLENTGLLDKYTLYYMKYMTVDSSALFYYVLRSRLKSFIILAVFATTYLGLPVCAGFCVWYGMASGAFLTAAMIRYGIKGVFFVLTGIFPQGIIYVPAMIWLLLWCQKLNRKIYFSHGEWREERYGIQVPKRMLELLCLFGIVVLGCLLESFVNPKLMLGLLKIF